MATFHSAKRRITKAEVAKRARVPVATVSYLVNNGPRPVAEATRKRALRAIQALGYRPSGVVQSLRLQRTRTIGLIVPDTANPFFLHWPRRCMTRSSPAATVSCCAFGICRCARASPCRDAPR